jgi:putative ABC transport system permease protein
MRTSLPHLASWLLDRLVPHEWRDSIAGDLLEERRRRIERGRRAGSLWAITSAARVGLGLALDRRRHRTLGPLTPPTRSLPMDGLVADLRQAARGLAANRGFALTALVTLALGIGANAAVFSLANWVLLRPVPGVADQSKLVTLGYGSGGTRGPVAFEDFEALAAGMPALDSLAGYESFAMNIAHGSSTPRRLDGEVVTGRFFDVLGGPLALGRGFTVEEGRRPERAPVAVLSYRLWQGDFAGAPGIVGQAVAINGQPFTIVGVAARGFHGASLNGSADLWVPFAQYSLAVPNYPKGGLTGRRVAMLFGLVGRLAAGGSIDAARQQAEAVRARLAADNPGDSRLEKWRFEVAPGVEARPWVRERLSQAMALVMGFVGLLLLLTSANVGNLMLARATGRRGEIATRLALGASRWRVARLLFAESLLLSLAAGVVALGLAWWTGRLMAGTIVLQGLPPLERVEIDARVFLFSLAVSALVALTAGVLPAFSGGRVNLTTALGDIGRSRTSARRGTRRALATLQVAVSVTLLIGALLLARSMAARLAVNPGFDPSRVLAFSVEPGLQGYGPRQEVFYRDLLDRLRDRPGIRAAGLAWLQPYSQGAADTRFRREGQPASVEIDAATNAVSPGYFDALGLSLVEGRDFTASEFQRKETGQDGVVILTESLARRVFGAAPAAGGRIAMAYPEGVVRTVVGVVADTRQRRLTAEPTDTLFEPFGQQFPVGWASVMVGLAAPEDDVVREIRTVVGSLDPAMPIYNVTRLDEAIRRQFADDLLVMRLTVAFAGLATLVAAIGLYGVLARGVAERRREFGIRVALGARPAGLARLVTKEALGVAGAGLTIGLAATFWGVRVIASRLYDTSRFDPMAIGASVMLVVLVILASAVAPARRAARVDAASELRS